MLCILYVNLVGGLLGAVALLTERILPAVALRRWIWLTTLGASMFIPGYYRVHHNWALVGDATQAAPAAMSAAPMRPLIDLQWWAHTDSWGNSIERVWLALSAILIAWALANAVRVWHVTRTSGREDSRRTTVIDGVPVVVTDKLGPATVGLLRSRVLLPHWVLTLPAAQRQYVLRHEDEHRRSHDGLLLFLASLPLVLAPWNLAFWWQLRRLYLAVEMDCDNRVIDALGDAHRYGELLLRVAEAGSHGPRLQPAFLGAGNLERRLTQLLSPRPLRSAQRVLVPALALALIALVAWMPHPISGLSTHHHAVAAVGAATVVGAKP